MAVSTHCSWLFLPPGDGQLLCMLNMLAECPCNGDPTACAIAEQKAYDPDIQMPINEIYPTISGEGTSTGRVCTIVRLTGCNLRCTYCLTAHTWISTPTGHRRIQDIDVGEEVLSYDEVTGGVSISHVSKVHSRFVPREEVLFIKTAGQYNKLYITREHPVYVRDRWVSASDVVPGDNLYILKPFVHMDFNNPVRDPKVHARRQAACRLTIEKRGYKPFSLEHRLKISRTKKRMYDEGLIERLCGDCNPNWRGGRSTYSYANTVGKILRAAIFERDGYVCQECGETSDLVVHHIDHNPYNNSWENLLTLCRRCNSAEQHVFRRAQCQNGVEVVSVEPVNKKQAARLGRGDHGIGGHGDRVEVFDLTTTRGNFFANRLLVHNCDSVYAYEGGKLVALKDVVAAVLKFGIRTVLFTGGEPLLHEQPAAHFLRAMLDQQIVTYVETNGSINIWPFKVLSRIVMDIKTPSSGMHEKMYWDNLNYLGPNDEIKFVVADERDYKYTTTLIAERRLLNITPNVFISPAWSEDKGFVQALSQWMVRDVSGARLMLQQHKYIWGPSTRSV